MVWTPLLRHLRSDTRAPANSIANTAASSASPRYATSKRVGLLVLQRLATDSRAELDYVRMVGNSECAGINRHVVGDERALRERRTASPSWPQVLQAAP